MRRFLAITMMAFVAIAAAAFAQDPQDGDGPAKKFQVRIPYDGPEIFARLLDHAGLKPIESIDHFIRHVAASPEKTVLIVFGDPAPLVELEREIFGRAVGEGLGAFLDRGGALLIASDRRFEFGNLASLGWHNARISGNELLNFNQNFQGQAACPTLEINAPNHKIFADIKQPIATNCPRQIVIGNSQLRTLASLPRDTVDIVPGTRPTATPRPYIATDPKWRSLVFAGHGLFTNFMIIRDDIDNRQLAFNTINWLKDEKRTQVLFINESRVVTNFKLPLSGPPRLPTPTIDLINRVIDQIQKTEIVQKLIERSIGPEPIVRGIVVLATALLLIYGVKKFFQNTWRLEATPALVGAPPPKSASLLKQQVREIAVRQQFGEPAQALARDWLRTYAQVDFTPGHVPAKLEFDIRTGLLERRKLAKHLTSLWKLATEPSPANWDAAKFRGLAAFLEELTLATTAGQVIFSSTAAGKS